MQTANPPAALDLTATLARHAAWLNGDSGARAYLRGADLSGANLSRANLSGADLSGADLSGADLSRADLSRADLSRADLSDADLSDADLSRAYLRDADLRGGLKAGRLIGQATRGIDSYVFTALETDSGETFIFAGCRAFLRSEFIAHIAASYPDTAKARRTMACLDYLEALGSAEQEA